MNTIAIINKQVFSRGKSRPGMQRTAATHSKEVVEEGRKEEEERKRCSMTGTTQHMHTWQALLDKIKHYYHLASNNNTNTLTGGNIFFNYK